ncbi:hypothetical protein D3C81_538100 [compost metagenome]
MNVFYTVDGQAGSMLISAIYLLVARPEDLAELVTSDFWRNHQANDNSYMSPDVCGALTWKQSWEASEGNSNTQVIKEPILAAHAKAIQQMIQDIRPTAQQIVAGQKPAPGVIDAAANTYENSLRAAAKTAVMQTSDRAAADFLKPAKGGGWLCISFSA